MAAKFRCLSKGLRDGYSRRTTQTQRTALSAEVRSWGGSRRLTASVTPPYTCLAKHGRPLGTLLIRPLPARWQSGHAEDCKSSYVGSIPARASIRSSLWNETRGAILRSVASAEFREAVQAAQSGKQARP